MRKDKYLAIINYLRQNARTQLSTISRKTGISVTTIYDQLKAENNRLIRKYAALLNFEELGFNAKMVLVLSVYPEDKERLKEFLMKNCQVNSLYTINNGFDFLAEGIFRQIKNAEQFLEKIEQEFKIRDRHVHYVIEDLKQETFLSNPHLPYSI
jgi:DNA-binding Lrp family transcriptional regulator